jgi:energy-coupling factor transporter transmembrane protein EcfT
MIHNLMARPFIALCLLLVCVYISESFIGYLILFSILLSTCLFLFNKYKQSTNLNWLWFIPVILALCWIRLTLHHHAHHHVPTTESLNLQDKWAIVKESTQSIQSADLIVSITDKHESILAKIKIDSLCHKSKIYAGDSILLNGILNLIKFKAQFDGFDYNKYLLRNHIQFTGRFNSNNIQIVPKKKFDIVNAANKANVYISNILFQSISDPQLANLLICHFSWQ